MGNGDNMLEEIKEYLASRLWFQELNDERKELYFRYAYYGAHIYFSCVKDDGAVMAWFEKTFIQRPKVPLPQMRLMVEGYDHIIEDNETRTIH